MKTKTPRTDKMDAEDFTKRQAYTCPHNIGPEQHCSECDPRPTTTTPPAARAETDTPRTDKQRQIGGGDYIDRDHLEKSPEFEYVSADFARQLERDLTAAQAENARLKEFETSYHKANSWNDTSDNLEDWIQNLVPEITHCMLSERSVIQQVVDMREAVTAATKARDAALARATALEEALKAHDKWRRKEENQGQSKEGYRDSWLCKATREALPSPSPESVSGEKWKPMLETGDYQISYYGNGGIEIRDAIEIFVHFTRKESEDLMAWIRAMPTTQQPTSREEKV